MKVVVEDLEILGSLIWWGHDGGGEDLISSAAKIMGMVAIADNDF